VGHMSVSRLAIAFLAFAIGAAVVSALAANPDERPPPMSPVTAPAAAGSEANAATGANAATRTKSDRLAIPSAKPRPLSWACPQQPWPYGCQWREKPTRKVLRPSRPR
jgi:hypothetical protein